MRHSDPTIECELFEFIECPGEIYDEPEESMMDLCMDCDITWED